MYDYRNVPQEEMENFNKNEAEFWSKVAANLLKKKQITGWAMLSRVGGLESDPNIYFYVGLGSYENLDNINKNYPQAYEEVMSSLDQDAQKLFKERLKQKSYRIANVLLNRSESVFSDSGDWNYMVHNYVKAKNVNAFLEGEKKYFKPFFEEHIKAKNTKQVAWITASVLNPRGNHYNWNCYTADLYKNQSDIYNAWNSEITYPEDGLAEVGKTMEGPGFYKSVVWQKLMWINEDGSFHTASD
jgi:hypothetical protein